MNTWEENSKLVLVKLEDFEGDIKNLEKEVSNLKIEIAVHSQKMTTASGFWGAISGMIVAILTAIIINYVVKEQPRVIYKDDNKIELNKIK